MTNELSVKRAAGPNTSNYHHRHWCELQPLPSVTPSASCLCLQGSLPSKITSLY